MKILIILLRKEGGVGRANSELAESLKRKGHQVDILSREDDLKVFSLIKSLLPFRKKIHKLMKLKNYDIIYTQDYSCTIPLFFPFPIYKKKHFACFCGVKSGKHPKLIQWHHKFLQRLTGRIMGTKLVVIGDELKKIFPQSKLIYRGVNLKKFKPLGKKRNCIGWINKDIEKISKEELKIISSKEKLKLLIAEKIPPEEMNGFYNKCKVFIDLPRTAGFNLAWLEAMAAGVPIIIGNEKGAGSIIPFDKILNGENNIDKTMKIIKNPQNINYRDWIIKNKFTWEDKADELEIFFQNSKNE